MTSLGVVLSVLAFALPPVLGVSRFAAYKFEQEEFTPGQKECFVHRYDYGIAAAEGEEMKNYLPVASYKSDCYEGYTVNQMNMMRGRDGKFYLVHCLFIPSENQRVVCDLFVEGGSVNIVDFECKNPKLNGVNKASFYMANFLTGYNPKNFLYGNAIVYSEAAGACAKQRGFEPVKVLAEFRRDGYNVWDAYLNEGHVFETKSKRNVFRGKNHRIHDNKLGYGDVNQPLFEFAAYKDYDYVINTELTMKVFEMPSDEADGLIGYDIKENKWIDVVSGEDYTAQFEYLKAGEALQLPSLSKEDDPLAAAPHFLNLFWDKATRQAHVYKAAKWIYESDNGYFVSMFYRQFPGDEGDAILKKFVALPYSEKIPGSTYTDTKDADTKHMVALYYENGLVEWFYSKDIKSLDIWTHATSFDPLHQETVSANIEDNTLIVGDAGAAVNLTDEMKFGGYSYLANGHHHLLRIRETPEGPIRWTALTEKAGDLIKALSANENIYYVFEKMLMFKLLKKPAPGQD